MSEQLTRIESLLVTLSGQVMDKFDKVDARLEAMDQRFEAMDQKFEAMDQRFEAMDQRFEARFQAMDIRLDELDGDIKQRFQTMDTRFDSMQAQLDRMEEAQAEDIVGILRMTDAKLDTVKALCEHTLKEQALLKYELDRLKPSLLSQSNKLFMNDLE
ncbi:hypothetical protein [Paenibacillus sp. PAMC21692]|uniref:hypothetical protein n=1 Tax=Paenibacillus sp. PAMC21692 TaxID=2762320 RepID=UPI00164D9366|nr:hypothetical protein [Paenibacillus sp. PAMC21692]QNK58925.1 hypothetical protein H7F31_08695 [Paenibacillus sp. PAMC21692]